MLIHSIIRGDEIRAEEIIADNIILIAQGLGGKGKIAFPSTIYKLCKAAKQQQQPQYVTYADFQQFQQSQIDQMQQYQQSQVQLMQQYQQSQAELMQQYQQNQMEAQQQGFLKLNEQVANMHIGIQTELSNYKEEVQTLKEKQQELFTNTNNMCNQTVGRNEQMNKVMEAWTEQRGYMEDMSKQMKKWTRNASARECYDIWAHQQLNPNLVEMPVTKLVKLIYENCDKKRPAFLGCLKSNNEAGSSSQATPPAIPTAAPTSAATTTAIPAPAPAPAPQHAQDNYYLEQFFQN
ncbi:hypothetical protein PIB30_068818 [Stylosanthes scabra]|uniref:Uncharacterized protein n=1 Tax=Stylosanthes scabra TaxID=79078 RepID=A0ABU6RNK8_9FABA|nr:hypothetical protein [Stylosanthes scabra]